MNKYYQPKCKKCRRAAQKLFLKGERCNTSKCAMVKRNFPPGIHGSKGYPRLTEYGIQIAEKQKAKRYYNLLEKQFSNYFAKASGQKGNTEERFFQLLERRLDNVIFQLGLAESRNKARQIIGHGHIQVNGKKVTIPSFQVRINDEISISPKSLESKVLFKTLAEKLKSKEVANWLLLDKENLKAKVVDMPSVDNIPSDLDFKLIVEFYSR